MKWLKYILFGLTVSSSVIAEEIQPTPELIDRAQQQLPGPHEYHFRKVGDHTLVCAYNIGANWGFCSKGDQTYVAKIDKAAMQWCKDNKNSNPPHYIYGDARDLDYKCIGSRMTRLPYSYGFDDGGYVRRDWRVLY